jgi:hypothetical protein
MSQFEGEQLADVTALCMKVPDLSLDQGTGYGLFIVAHHSNKY